MNRQIKFRDFCFDTNKMRYFDLDHYDKNEHDCFGNIMQFTGLVDKNGVEIFEGDIVQTCTEKSMVVSWSKKFASFVLNKEGWAFSHWFGESCDPHDCIIIGNIHEHKHLL